MTTWLDYKPPNDQFKHLIVNPGHLTTKQQNSGILYAELMSSGRYNMKWIKKIKKKMPNRLKQLEQVNLNQAIAEIITNPNQKWKNLKREKYMTDRNYIQK